MLRLVKDVNSTAKTQLCLDLVASMELHTRDRLVQVALIKVFLVEATPEIERLPVTELVSQLLEDKAEDLRVHNGLDCSTGSHILVRQLVEHDLCQTERFLLVQESE